ncbi:MAG: hypothetical protein ACSLE4_03225 [Methyloceanibacter sp.]|uniref:hypothetical protein n=1 Tax=Methyloceanibacter sp. TaxID=1965321 RepID=UPI003EE0DDE8
MEKELAWEIVRVVFRNSRELQELLALLKDRATSDDYQAFAPRVAQGIDAINDALLNPVLAAHPEFSDRIKAELEAHGRID